MYSLRRYFLLKSVIVVKNIIGNNLESRWNIEIRVNLLNLPDRRVSLFA